MDPQELSDRAEITDLLVRYSRAVDSRRWDDLDALFTPEARIDYTAFGGIAGDLAEIKRFLAESMALFSTTQHMLGLPEIAVHGDRARSVTPCHNPMLLGAGRDARLMVCGLWYHSEAVRAEGRWYLSALWQEQAHLTVVAGGDPG